MEMKWHPIEDGNMKGVPRDEDIIFTVLDEQTREVYTAIGEVSDFFIDEFGQVFVGVTSYPVEVESLMAWMKLPQPFKLTPDKCFKCDHGKLQHDEFSDNWFECELLQRDVPPNGKPGECPLNR